MKRGKFIVFEGGDGTGTSTQARMLYDHYVSGGRKAVITAEPSEGPVGHLIRQGLTHRVMFHSDDKAFATQLAYLFAADRYDHLRNEVNGILALLDSGVNVICTRYKFSSFVYNVVDDGELVQRLNKDFIDPDLVIYLKGSVEEAIARADKRHCKDRHEVIEKQLDVIERYDEFFRTYPGDLLTINACQSIIDVHLEIINKITYYYDLKYHEKLL